MSTTTKDQGVHPLVGRTITGFRRLTAKDMRGQFDDYEQATVLELDDGTLLAAAFDENGEESLGWFYRIDTTTKRWLSVEEASAAQGSSPREPALAHEVATDPAQSQLAKRESHSQKAVSHGFVLDEASETVRVGRRILRDGAPVRIRFAGEWYLGELMLARTDACVWVEELGHVHLEDSDGLGHVEDLQPAPSKPRKGSVA